VRVQVSLYSLSDLDTRRGFGVASRPGRSIPEGKTRYALYRRLSGRKSRSGQVRKISPPSGFDLRTVQPVGSCYTNYATRPNKNLIKSLKFRNSHGCEEISNKLLKINYLFIHLIEIKINGWRPLGELENILIAFNIKFFI
jgi:hypothetical protein